MGSPEIALPALAVLAEMTTLAGVVTQPDRPAGRGKKLVPSAVKSFALSAEIPILQPLKLRSPEAFAELEALQPEIIVVMAYGQILRANVLGLPRYGCLNLHASLLPRWRGASPIQAAILAGDQQTGITLMKMDAGMDTGPIYTSRPLAIDPEETAETLSLKMADLAAAVLADSLTDVIKGTLQPQPQPEEGVSYAPLIKKEDGVLKLSQSAEILERMVKAYSPWPSVQLTVHGNSLKILKSRALENQSGLAAGTLTKIGGFPAVAVQNGILLLEEVQPSGKKAMSGKAFLSGFRHWEGALV